MVMNREEESPVISSDGAVANNLKVKTTLYEEFYLTEMSQVICEADRRRSYETRLPPRR